MIDSIFYILLFLAKQKSRIPKGTWLYARGTTLIEDDVFRSFE
ncbi:Hypothetical protein ACI5QL_03980 [Bacillus velezensis]|nr:hypothetical protein MY7_3559 [Bacillus sp. 5B6]RUS04959.1 hypothetical protein EFW58_02685 [Bacillus velezensis]